MSTTKIQAPDLTQRPPRSVRCRLGNIAGLPRMLDKCRATIMGQNGEFRYACPLDERILSFIGLDAEALKAEVASGKGDGEILEWIKSNSKTKVGEWEIEQWSCYSERRGPDSDPETLGYFVGAVDKLGKTRSDIKSWADLLDLDDHTTFGGLA